MTKVTKMWRIVFYGSHYLLGAKDSQAINQVITRLSFLLTGKLPCNRKKLLGIFPNSAKTTLHAQSILASMYLEKVATIVYGKMWEYRSVRVW